MIQIKIINCKKQLATRGENIAKKNLAYFQELNYSKIAGLVSYSSNVIFATSA
jgi:hypothetical protein